ncbi:MAG: hypothetical protein QXI32_01190 [Candidatus Bathyarchaeia archaeon]
MEFRPSRRSSHRVGLLIEPGKASFKITSELIKRGAAPVLLMPSKDIPLDIQVLLASKTYEDIVPRDRKVVWIEESLIEDTIDRVFYLLHGDGRFIEGSIGIDPGKEIGVAVVADGKLLSANVYQCADKAVEDVLKQVSALPCVRKTVKIGTGSKEYSARILSALLSQLPPEIQIQQVEEEGTTSNAISRTYSRSRRNAVSATYIAMRRGKTMHRNPQHVYSA